MANTIQVFIIGCGVVGKLLARRLMQNHVPVAACVSSENSQQACAALNIDCSIINLDRSLTDLDLTGQRIIYLVPPPRNGREDARMHRFLHAIAQHPPEKFVLISTTGVYGDCDGAWIDESTPVQPKADRAYRRADAEQQVQQFCQRHTIPWVILRVAGIYGPGKIPLKRIQSGEPIVNQQDSPFTNRIHVADLVTVCEKALMSMSIQGVYNVTDGHPGTMYEYFTGVARALSLPPPPAISLAQARQQLSAGMLSYMDESRRIRNQKLLRDFALELQYPDLESGLKSLQAE
jgi:nucleoside-diphosphate-sugar epimerase